MNYQSSIEPAPKVTFLRMLRPAHLEFPGFEDLRGGDVNLSFRTGAFRVNFHAVVLT